MTFANNCPNLNLDETIGQVLIEDIQQKSIRLTINESTEAHHSIELIERISRKNWSKHQSTKKKGRPTIVEVDEQLTK